MKQKILIIEDNEQNLYLLSYIVEKHGYEVSTAMDGKEGFEKMKFYPQIAQIFADCSFPYFYFIETIFFSINPSRNPSHLDLASLYGI